MAALPEIRDIKFSSIYPEFLISILSPSKPILHFIHKETLLNSSISYIILQQLSSLPHSIFSSLQPLSYLQFLKHHNKILSSFKILEIYGKFNSNYLLIRKYFNIWKNSGVFIKSPLVRLHFITQKGHCINCNCLRKNHCPGCYCSNYVTCLDCNCQKIEISLKKLIYNYWFLKHSNPKLYYFKSWYKKIKN